MSCPYRREHEFDADGLCKYCYAERPVQLPSQCPGMAAALQATEPVESWLQKMAASLNQSFNSVNSQTPPVPPEAPTTE